jgi:PAS domain S-box-containing protein
MAQDLAVSSNGRETETADRTRIEALEESLRQLEASLRERQRQLDEAHRIACLGTWRWDRSTDTATWSEEVYRIFGFDPAGPAPGYDRIRELHSPQSRALLEAAVTRALTSGEPYEHDIELLMPDGSLRWIIARGEVESRADGVPNVLRGTVQDITDRKLAEQQILRSENRYRSLVHASSDIVWITNPDVGQTTELPAWQAFTGQTAEQIMGMGWLDAIHPDDRQSTVDAWTQALESRSTYRMEHRLRRHDGVYRFMSARGVPSFDADGNIVEWVGMHTDVTERVEAEAALRDANARFGKLYAANLIGICYPDRFGAFSDGNAEFLRIVGYTRSELEQGLVRWDNMTPAQYAPLDAQHIAEAAALGSCTPYEKEYVRKDGTRVPILCGYALREGSTDEYIGFIMDLSPVKRAEAAVLQMKTRFEKLYHSDLMGIGFPDSSGAIHDCNDALLRLIGYTREDLLAGLVRWDTLTPPEYREIDLAHIAESAARGSCTPYEKEYIRKDGVRVPILCGFARITNGEQPESIGFVLDLSAQRKAELATRDREQRFSALAESLPQLVWASSPDGNRIYTNRRYSEYTGLTPDQLLGATWAQLLHPDDIDRTNELWYRCMSTGEPYLNEYRIRRHDGLFRSFLVRAIPVRNDAGEIQRWLGTATDIHDQKLAEEALRRSEKLAATGRLAASIAHEINNPLEAVTNALYLALMDTSLTPETRTYLNMADQELARVAQVTTQTLRFHRQSAAAAQVDLAEVMDSAFSLFAPRFEASRIVVLREYSPGHLLYCRGGEIRQVFVNFISNALDATRAGGRVRIRIRSGTDCGAAACPGIRVTIADTGHGIPAELRRSIFEPFVSTKEATGTGLGLWVTDGIVQKHGGRITLRSRTGEAPHGTVFTLFFPLEALNS